jgi:uncharacterized protein YuzE
LIPSDIVIDLDSSGRILGFEIPENARSVLPPEVLGNM